MSCGTCEASRRFRAPDGPRALTRSRTRHTPWSRLGRIAPAALVLCPPVAGRRPSPADRDDAGPRRARTHRMMTRHQGATPIRQARRPPPGQPSRPDALPGADAPPRRDPRGAEPGVQPAPQDRVRPGPGPGDRGAPRGRGARPGRADGAGRGPPPALRPRPRPGSTGSRPRRSPPAAPPRPRRSPISSTSPPTAGTPPGPPWPLAGQHALAVHPAPARPRPRRRDRPAAVRARGRARPARHASVSA